VKKGKVNYDAFRFAMASVNFTLLKVLDENFRDVFCITYNIYLFIPKGDDVPVVEPSSLDPVYAIPTT